MRPITALLVTGAVALPWYALVWDRTDGDWVKGFIFEHNVGRAAKPMEGHGGSLLVYPLMVLFFYPVSILVGFFPWSVLSVPVLADFVKRIRLRHPWAPGYVFVACWAGVYVVAFSMARTKLASYMTPMYPALALATGAFLYHWTRNVSLAAPKSVTDALRLMSVIGVVMILGLAIGAWVALRGNVWIGLAGLVPLVGGLAALRFAKAGRSERAAVALGVTATAAALVTTAVVVRIDRYQHSYPVTAAIHERSNAPRIRTFSRHEPSWVFYSGQEVPDAGGAGRAADFLASGPDAFIITSDDKYAPLEKAIRERAPGGQATEGKSHPPRIGVVAEAPYFGKTGKVLVIGHYAKGSAPPNNLAGSEHVVTVPRGSGG